MVNVKADPNVVANVITVGSPNGQLKSAFRMISRLCKAAPDYFNFAIIVGDLFGEEDEELADLLAEKIDVPLPTYFTVGFNPLPASVVEKLSNNQMLHPNLSYLNKRSTFTTSEGLKIVTLGGKFSNEDGLSQDNYLPVHTAEDAKALKGANTADILLTSQWPASIREGTKTKKPEFAIDPDEDENIAELCATLKPRFHFSTSNYFFDREPFVHPRDSENPDRIPFTKFVSIAPHINKPPKIPPGTKDEKQCRYGCSFAKVPATSPPMDSTGSPFKFSNMKRKQAFDSTPYSRFAQNDNHRHKRARGSDRGPPPTSETCFFCLSSPQFKQHLVTNVGDESYLALPRGPLTTKKTNSNFGIPFPAHILICPTYHSPTVATAIDTSSGENRSEETYIEMTRFRTSLQAMVSSLGKGALGAVTYEISASWNIHNQWQFIPINETHTKPHPSTGKSNVEAAFRIQAENVSFPPFQERDPGVGSEEGDFFRVWIWTPSTDGESAGTEKCITMPLDALNNDKRFDPQFGRRVLAKLLGLEDRTLWRDCAQTEAEETANKIAFREAFQEFDFSGSGTG